MTDSERIDQLERRLLAMHAYNQKLLTLSKCHDGVLKVLCGRLGIEWELVELPAEPVN